MIEMKKLYKENFEWDLYYPLLTNLQYVDRRCVIAFLIEERYPLFEKTSLFLEYLLCCRLRDVEVDFESKTFKGI